METEIANEFVSRQLSRKPHSNLGPEFSRALCILQELSLEVFSTLSIGDISGRFPTMTTGRKYPGE